MILPANGKLNDFIFAMGDPVYPAYLINTPEKNVMIEAGLNIFGPSYLTKLDAILGSYKNLDALYITHPHYDHMGSLPFISRQIPDLETGGHERFNTLMKKESVLSLMNNLSKNACDWLSSPPDVGDNDISITESALSRVLKEGDRIEFKDFSIDVYETPGHTRDHLSFFISELGLLFPGEALGNPAGDGRKVKVEFVSSYTDYMASIEKLAKLNIKTIAMSHLFMYLGEDTKIFLEATHTETIAYMELISKYLNEGNGDIQSAVSLMVTHEYEKKGDILMEKEAYIANLMGQVKAIYDLHST